MGANKKQFLKASLFCLFFLGLIISWLAFGDRGFIHLYRMNKERQEYLKKIDKLEATNKKLMNEIKKLRNDRDYIESTARKELGLVKKDEVIYKFSHKN